MTKSRIEECAARDLLAVLSTESVCFRVRNDEGMEWREGPEEAVQCLAVSEMHEEKSAGMQGEIRVEIRAEEIQVEIRVEIRNYREPGREGFAEPARDGMDVGVSDWSDESMLHGCATGGGIGQRGRDLGS